MANTTLIDDRVELVETDDTYLELWERLGDQDRGPWLVQQGFRVTANKDRVTVSQGSSVGEVIKLGEPERKARVRKYWGKCGCGCGSDLYGFSGHGRKMYVNHAHGAKARRERAAAGLPPISRANFVERSEPVPTPAVLDPELVYRGKCACGCGSEVYGNKYAPQMKYVNKDHQTRTNNARAARRRAARNSRAADPQEP